MYRPLPRLLALCTAVLTACGGGDPSLVASGADATLPQCTVTTIRGTPIEGVACGGASYASSCTPGVLYKCTLNSSTNNCTLQTTCASGCLTGSGSNKLNDTCFSGTAPFALGSSSLVGGSQNATGTVTLNATHVNGGTVNMHVDRADLVAARASCNVPNLPVGVNTATFQMPTAVVSGATPVSLYANIAYTDSSGISRQLVSKTSTLTLNAGGTEPAPPPVASFTLNPNSVAPGGVSTMYATLAGMAPISGVPVSVSSSNPAVASVIPGGEPVVLGGCTTSAGTSAIQAANTVSQTTTVQISATDAAPGATAVTNPFTVTAGCTPLTCVDVGSGICSASDGCGGTLACGCPQGGVCQADGTCAAPAVGVNILTLSPTGVAGGSSSTATITLTGAAPSGGAVVTLASNNAAAQVPASVTVPAGATSASFTVTTSPVTANTSATISATLNGTVVANLSIGAAAAPATLIVTATGRSGITISSNPAGISVPVGQTQSATFNIGTSITLSTSDRTAIWSGACATSRDTSSCTFTIQGDSSVTGMVQ